MVARRPFFPYIHLLHKDLVYLGLHMTSKPPNFLVEVHSQENLEKRKFLVHTITFCCSIYSNDMFQGERGVRAKNNVRLHERSSSGETMLLYYPINYS